MNAPSGVKISVYNLDTKENGGLVEVAKDGYLGNVKNIALKQLKSKTIMGSDETLKQWQSLLVEVEVAPGVEVYAFNVNDHKDVVAARNWRIKPLDNEDPALDAPEGAKVYRRFVPVTESELRVVPTTKFPNNNIRLLEALGDGYFQLWRVAIVSQYGDFFLTVEKVREPFRCYRSGEISVVCPAHVENEKQKGWPRLLTLLNSVLTGETFQSLPPIKELTNPTKPASVPSSHKTNGIEDGEARVAFFADAEGWGMLHTKEGAARVHWQNVNRPGSRRTYLKPGELVSYTELTKPHLTRERGTGFKLEAVGVTLKEEKTE